MCDLEDNQRLLLEEIQVASSLLSHTSQMLEEAQEEADVWREEAALVAYGRSEAAQVAEEMVANVVEAVGIEREVEMMEIEDERESMFVFGDGVLAQVSAEREIALARGAADAYQVSGVRSRLLMVPKPNRSDPVCLARDLAKFLRGPGRTGSQRGCRYSKAAQGIGS